ncbi:hypothetical protein BDA96_10G214300 [Sorghum bicolor]|uniref:Uncharacterized protein n=1 Tax=Sorghum bicolor TaxID=4558 RepID=A0A921Q5F8_SORBI|nr:hypothetical protein BDA96_10G214300 [Sorghum bicolor]
MADLQYSDHHVRNERVRRHEVCCMADLQYSDHHVRMKTEEAPLGYGMAASHVGQNIRSQS